MIRFILADEEHAARLDEIDGCRLSTAEVQARLPGAQILDPGELARRWNDGELEGRRAAVFDDGGAGPHGECHRGRQYRDRCGHVQLNGLYVTS